jgi:hypothetical protein
LIFARIDQEYSFDSYLSRCPALVSFNSNLNQFQIHSDKGDLTLNNFLEPQSQSLSLDKTFIGYEPGLEPGENGVDPSFGISNEYAVTVPDRFSLDGQHQLKWIYRQRRPNLNWNFAYTAQYDRIVAAASIAFFLGAIVILLPVSAQAGAIAAFVLIIGSWYHQATGLPLGNPVQAFQSKSYALADGSVPVLQTHSFGYTGVTEPPSGEVVQALKNAYGPLVDFAEVGVLVPDKHVISAYTIFTFEGVGFAPDSDVYVSFNRDGNPEPIRENFFHTDSLGHLNGSFEMPAPDQTPLGSYLLAAVDSASLNNSLDHLIAGQSTSLSLYMAAAKIDVVEDVTPPAITIISPTATSYNRCDQPYIDFNVVDDLSGVAKVNAWVDGVSVKDGDRMDMLFWNLGEHTVKIQAFDKVGWEQNTSLTFQLRATIKGTQCALDRFQALQLLRINGTYASISAHLSSADRALAAEKPNGARNEFKSILKILDAQKNKIDPRAYEILWNDIQSLLLDPMR